MHHAKHIVLTLCLALLAGEGVCLPQVESRTASLDWPDDDDEFPVDRVENPVRDLSRKIEVLQQEVQELRGKVEEQDHRLNEVQEAQKNAWRQVNVPVKPSSSITFSNETPAGDVVSKATSAQEEGAYQAAYRLIQNKDYSSALKAFELLLKTFPKGKYVPNAHYWLGEIYLAKNDLELAAKAFDRVYRDYPQHPKTADSLLKLGYIEYDKGDWKKSQILLTQVRNQFPGTISSQLADSRLERMRQEGRL